VYLFKETGRNGLFSRSDARTFRLLHSTAGGKAILSTWPREKVETYIDRCGLKQLLTRRSPARTRCSTSFEGIRDRGYATTNNEETVEGPGAVSVPIENTDDAVVGAPGIWDRSTGSGTAMGRIPNLLDAKKRSN